MRLDTCLKSKKTLLGVVFLLVAAGFIFGMQFRRNAAEQSALETELREIEENITSTEKRMRELSELSLEEISRREKEREILSALGADDDVPVPGVEITVAADKKIITNAAEGYKIEIPKNLIIARSVSSDHLELHDKAAMCHGDPLCKPVILLSVLYAKPGRLTLEDWFLAEEKKAGTAIYSPREKSVIGNETVYKVTESDPPLFDNRYYFWSKENKIYSLRISATEEPNYSSYIKTFALKP